MVRICRGHQRSTNFAADVRCCAVGPATYVPSVNVEVLDTVKGQIIEHGTALHLSARRNHVDPRTKVQRKVSDLNLLCRDPLPF